MEKGKIGVQMMMLKEEIAQRGIYPVMEQLAGMGFSAVEVSQIDMTPENVQALARAGRELGVQTAAMSCTLSTMGLKVPCDTLEDDFDKIVADCHAVECGILRIGMLPMSCADTPEHMLEMADQFEVYAKRLKEHGIDLYYHAHTMEFIHKDGKPVLTHMRERTEAMGFELDSHWMWRGGVDPVAYIRSFAGRIRLLHLKDYRVGPMPDLSKLPPEQFMFVFGMLEQFAEVGEGALDMPAIIDAGLASGSEYFLIEQDDRYGRSVWDSLKISRDNLVKMGYGDWF